MDLQFYRESVQQHGVSSTLMYAAYRAANQLAVNLQVATAAFVEQIANSLEILTEIMRHHVSTNLM